MSVIGAYIEVLDEVKSLEKEIKPLQDKLNDRRNTLSELNERLPFMFSLRDFLSMKIIETYSQEELKLLNEYRKYCKDLSNSNRTYYDARLSKVFDPLFDNWYIFDYEKNDNGEIRFKVSCKKNEGTISGLMTFLDVHYTSWFNPKEIEELD